MIGWLMRQRRCQVCLWRRAVVNYERFGGMRLCEKCHESAKYVAGLSETDLRELARRRGVL